MAGLGTLARQGRHLTSLLRLGIGRQGSLTWQVAPIVGQNASQYSTDVPREYALRNYANNVTEYNNTLMRVNQLRRAYLLRDVYDDMSLDGVQPLADTFSLLITGCLRGSRLQDAMYFFEEMKSMGLVPDETIFNCLIAICGRCKQIHRAFQIAEEMEVYGLTANARTLTTLLSACGVAGAPETALGVIRRMTAAGMDLSIYCYSALIMAYKNEVPLRENVWEKVFELLNRYRSKAHGEASQGDYTDQLDEELYNLQSGEFLALRGGARDKRLSVYHAALSACADFANAEGLRSVLEMMKEEKLIPDLICIAEIMRCHLKSGELESAWKAFQGYLNSGRQLQSYVFMVFIKGAIQGYTQAGMNAAKSALEILDSKNVFFDPRAGNEILEMASREQKGDYAVANLIFDMMQKRKMNPGFRSLQSYLRGLQRRQNPDDESRIALVEDQISKAAGRAGRRSLPP